MKRMPRQDVAGMVNRRDERVELRAAGAICPMPECGALVVNYEPVNSLNVMVGAAAPRTFICPQCGSEFSTSQEGLLFQSVPQEWLFASVSHA